MTTTDSKARSGARRAATLLGLVPDEVASQILAHLSEREVEAIGVEMARLGRVSPDELREVVRSYFVHLPMDAAVAGGLDRFRKLLSTTKGPAAGQVAERVARSVEGADGLDVKDVDPASLAGILQAEPPQVGAVILSLLDPKLAADVLNQLDPDSRITMSTRLATLGEVDPETLADVLAGLELRLSSLGQTRGRPADGIRVLASIINHLDPDASGQLLDGLEGEDPELAQTVRDRSVVFEDILYISDREMASFVQRIDKKLLPLALKGATEEVKAKFFKGMSSRASTMMEEEMQLLGAVRLKEVEQSQMEVVAILRKLIEEGSVVLDKGGEGYVT